MPAMLNAIAGPAATSSLVHTTPFQIQVSGRYPTKPVPPNITSPESLWEYAIAAPYRGAGVAAGCNSAQVWPSHANISPTPPLRMSPLVEPPNRTTLASARSYAMIPCCRADGLAAGVSCFQFAPSHVQVSLSSLVQ